MRLTTGRYVIILSIQTFLMIIDWVINICSLLTRENNAVMIILFIAQDACLILALSALLLTFFSTYVFQTGLVYLLYERFRVTLLVCMIYFVFTTLVHIWSMITRWNNIKHSWSTSFLIVFVLQRFHEYPTKSDRIKSFNISKITIYQVYLRASISTPFKSFQSLNPMALRSGYPSLVATVYYYYYKRAALRISDPRFYEDIELDHNKIQQINGQVN